jgi:hypothetical protein
MIFSIGPNKWLFSDKYLAKFGVLFTVLKSLKLSL